MRGGGKKSPMERKSARSPCGRWEVRRRKREKVGQNCGDDDSRSATLFPILNQEIGRKKRKQFLGQGKREREKQTFRMDDREEQAGLAMTGTESRSAVSVRKESGNRCISLPPFNLYGHLCLTACHSASQSVTTDQRMPFPSPGHILPSNVRM